MKKNLIQLFGCAAVLAAFTLTATVSNAAEAEKVEEVIIEAPSVKNIASVQPYSELTYYAVALTRVEITYNDNVDLSGIAAEDYHLADRGWVRGTYLFDPFYSETMTFG